MARILDESPLPFRLAATEVPVADDEIAPHLEALEDGREPEPRLVRAVDLQDDEIDSHLEAGEMVFAHLPDRKVRRRRPTRH